MDAENLSRRSRRGDRPCIQEIALLYDYLAVGAMLFGVGLVGFLSRRNMIVMFLSAEMMLQGVSVSLVAWGRYHNDFGGQMLVIFIIAVAACEAAIALALMLTLFQRNGKLDIAAWQQLREADQPLVGRGRSLAAGVPIRRHWPQLAPAGVPPEISRKTNSSGDAMFDIRTLLILIPALPLAATLLTAVLGKHVLRTRSHLPVVLAIGRFLRRQRAAGLRRPARPPAACRPQRRGEDHRLFQDRSPLDLGERLGLPSPFGRGAGGEGFCTGKRVASPPSP